MTRTFSCPAPAIVRGIARVIHGIALVLASLLAAPEALAGAIVVGRDVGPGRPCTVATIQAAIDRANGLGGHNLILVTDDVPNAVYHENLNLSGLHQGLTLELVGGYNNCTDLQPTAFGKASVYGGGQSAPVMNIDGRANLMLRGFWMEGGRIGIKWRGHGRVEVVNSTVNNNRDQGFHVEGSGGEASLELMGTVQITDNERSGIYLWNQARLKMRGDQNRILRNENALYIEGTASADVGATGEVIADNRNVGIYAVHAHTAAPPSYFYSTDPARPLTVTGNGNGAIHHATAASRLLCIRNVGMTENTQRLISVDGPGASLEMNGSTCVFPTEASIVCPTPSNISMCNRISSNLLAEDTPLIAALKGAHVELHRVLIANNTASSILSTNLGGASGSSAITVTTSVVRSNSVRDNLIESLHGGIVDIWDSTLFNNVGPFQISLVGIQPGLLQLTNSIVDQTQTLFEVQGTSSSARVTRSLVQNSHGTGPLVQDNLRIGQPIYADGLGRLEPRSPGVDYAPAGGGVDLDGHPRDVDTIGVPNTHGPRDIGAFEVQVANIDGLFRHGFE